MILVPESGNVQDYLVNTEIIDYSNPYIQKLKQKLSAGIHDEIELVRNVYEYVRDHISHSFDINGKTVTYKASDVLIQKEGICYAKSHLLAALLRSMNIPTGFCYQKLILDDATDPYLVYHGLNAVYLKPLNRWIRLDARGNKTGVDAQFSLDKEHLAFKVRKEMNEEDWNLIYVHPLAEVLSALRRSGSVGELRNNLPK